MTPRRPADPPHGPRRIIGRYRLDAELGRGAMGTVWRAYDEVLHRPVAVKEVRLSLVPVGERAVVRERTLREARATAMLSHPNVVTLYDVVEVASEPYVVMELLPSRSLAAYIIERGTLTHVEAAEIGSAVASALITAHRAGITHRDVKPGNVLIGGPGQIKLTDFGIARNAAESSMTQTGTVLGSPPYIAPEVAMGRAVGPAADLWGLGATLYACIEGRPPYDAGDPVATVSAVVHGEVPPPTGQGPVVDVIRGLMVKDPALRMPLPAVRRRLRQLLPGPEDAVVSAPAPTGPAGAPGPTGSDRSGLIPIRRDRPGAGPGDGTSPRSDQGPATAASPEALPETAEGPEPTAERGDAAGPEAADPDAAGPDAGEIPLAPREESAGDSVESGDSVDAPADPAVETAADETSGGGTDDARAADETTDHDPTDEPTDEPGDGGPADVAADDEPADMVVTGAQGDAESDESRGTPDVAEDTDVAERESVEGPVDGETVEDSEEETGGGDTGTDPGTDLETETETESETESEPEPELETGPETASETAEPDDAASATRIVAAPTAAAATTTVTPQLPTEGPTRRVPRSRLPQQGQSQQGRSPQGQAPPRPPVPARPAGPPPAPPGVASRAQGPEPAASQSLAADPGPLPFSPRPGAPDPGDRRVTIAVAVLVVVLVVLGAVGGYALARSLGGQSAVGVALAPDGPVVDDDVLVPHADTNARYGGTGLGFTVLTPASWQQFRLQQRSGDVAVRFVSPDSSRELRVDRIVGFFPDQAVTSYVALLSDPSRLGVDTADADPLTAVGPARAGAPEPVQQTVYRTRSAPDDLRTTWARVVPTARDLWVVRLTAPTAAPGQAAEEFRAVADSFAPPA